MNQVIDFERKGNVLRFYTGHNGEQWGDDWNDAPYEHNAGSVYGEYVTGSFDVVVPFDYEVLAPCDGAMYGNSKYSKEDMRDRTIPCILIAKDDNWNIAGFDDVLELSNALKIYFGDTKDQVLALIAAL